MPTYDYRCTACKHEFEQFQSMKDASLRKCPRCGKSALERLIGTGAAILFKGSGFYQTDYRSESYKKSAEAESKSAAPAAPATPAPAPGASADSAGAPAPTTAKTDSSAPATPAAKPDKPSAKPESPGKPRRSSSKKKAG